MLYTPERGGGEVHLRQFTIHKSSLWKVLVTGYRVLRGTAGYCKVLQGTAKYCKVLQGTAKYCKVLQGTAKYCKVLQGTGGT